MSRSIPPTSEPRTRPVPPAARSLVDAVVWDFGNVLVRWDPAAAVADRWDRALFAELVERSGFSELNDNLDRDAPNHELLVALESRDAEAAAFWRYYEENAPSSIFPDIPGTPELVHELADAGVPQYGLTNWSRSLAPLIAEIVPASTRLQGRVVSSLVGQVKPGSEIFHTLIERFSLTPARTLFIDDRPENTAAAAALGFQTHTFHPPGGAPVLRAHLARLGLPVAAGGPRPRQ
nr:HAD family phosphatase [Actinomycetales bacterium]